MRKFANITAAAAVVITSVGLAATPADARGRHGGWGYRDRDRISTGEVIGGLLILGTIFAIADSASKNKEKRREQPYEPPYQDDEYRQVPRYDAAPNDTAPSGPYGASEAEARAADACSWAVEAEMGDDARVDRVDSPQPSNGGWYVTGVASRLGGQSQSFACDYRGGRVIDVRFAG